MAVVGEHLVDFQRSFITQPSLLDPRLINHVASHERGALGATCLCFQQHRVTTAAIEPTRRL